MNRVVFPWNIGRIAGLPVRITDTGGLDDRGSVCTDIQIQIEYAIKTADVILFMLDARSGVNMIDEHFAKWLRVKLGTILVLQYPRMTNSADMYTLGI